MRTLGYTVSGRPDGEHNFPRYRGIPRDKGDLSRMKNNQRRHIVSFLGTSRIRWGMILTLPLLLLGTLACTLPFRSAEPAPFPEHRRAFRPAYVTDLELPQLQQAPRYAIREVVDVSQRTITGTQVITVTNTTSTTWASIGLRLYPNLAHYGGGMEILSLAGNGAQLPFGYTETKTGVMADLADPLAPGETLHVSVTYSVRYHRWDVPGYWLFGEREGVINLPLAYPVLAVPRPDGTWNMEDGIPLGDTLTAATAFYRAWVTVPQTLTLISSAVISATQVHTPTGQITYELVSGPARELTLLLGSKYQAVEREVDGIHVRSYYLPGDEQAGEAALTYAAAALQVYSRHFGPYPFAKMDVAAAMLMNRGMEYPTLNLLGVDLYRDERSKLEFLVVHEVAHQWWYNLVGNDQVAEPWLDEGLTEYSTYFYYEDIYGPRAAEALRTARWETPVEYIRSQGLDAPLGLAAPAYLRENYETVVYAKGALFFHELRNRLGDDVFHQVLRAYAKEYRYRLATAQELQALVTAVSGQNVDDLFDTWVYNR